jgi:hypothetical protein
VRSDWSEAMSYFCSLPPGLLTGDMIAGEQLVSSDKRQGSGGEEVHVRVAIEDGPAQPGAEAV